MSNRSGYSAVWRLSANRPSARPKIGSQIAVAKAALDRQHLDADRTEAS